MSGIARKAPTRGGTILARVFTCALGAAAALWGAAVLPIFWREAPLERMATRIANRETFKPEVIDALVPAVEVAERVADCRPEALRSAAIIRLRLAETAIFAAERQAIDAKLSAFRTTAVRSLACAPADPFLWMVLAWLDQTRNGFNADQLTFLRLSYRLGPNEGWIAARRNRFALAMYERLTPDLANAALDEFAGMVASGFYWEPIEIFTGPGWHVRDKLLARLKDVPERRREAFAKELYAQGYNVDVPGIPRHDARPWH